MPTRNPNYISRFTPEQVADRVQKGQLLDTRACTDKDGVEVKMSDGSWWFITATEMMIQGWPARSSSTRTVNIHTLIGTEWHERQEQRSIGNCDLDGERVIHVLDAGSVLCRFTSEPPYRWPKGHYWVPLAEDMRSVGISGKVACKPCMTLAVEEFQKRFPKQEVWVGVDLAKEKDFTVIRPIPFRAHPSGPKPASPPSTKPNYPPPNSGRCPGCSHPLSWDSYPSQQNYYCKQCGWNDAGSAQATAPGPVPSVLACPICSHGMQRFNTTWHCTNCGHTQP